MNEHCTFEADDDVADLGAASEVTRGIPDPIRKEGFLMPNARDD